MFPALLLLVLAGASADAAWRNIGPGGGGWIPCLAVSPHDSQIVYAGCDVGGFYKSTDAGASWQIRNAGLHDLYVEVIVPDPRDPNTLYVGTEGGVHKSTDGGETWQWLREGFPPPQSHSFSAPIGALAIDSKSPAILYAGIGRPRWGKSGAGTIYRSTDGGAHWQIANPGHGGMDPQSIISDLLIHPQDGKRLYAASDKGLYRSDDSGTTWRRLEKGLPHAHVRRVALCRARPEVMYVTLNSTPGQQPWQGGVYRSEDAGQTWEPRLQGLGMRVGKPGEPAPMTSNVDRIVVHPANPDIAYAGDTAWVSAGLYRTVDGGRSWKKVTERGGMEYGWITAWGPSVKGLAMDFNSPDTLYFSTSGHLFRTMDRGENWTSAYTQPAEKPAGAPVNESGYWSGTGLEVTCLNRVVIHPSDPRRLFFCYFDIGLLQSFDGGGTFTQTVQGMRHKGNTFTVAFDPGNPDIVFAGTGEWSSNRGDVCRSEDGGLTWTVVGKPDTGLPDGQTRHLIVDPDSPAAARRIYATVNGSGVYVSENGGKSWQARNEGLPSGALRSLVQYPRDPKVLYSLLAEGAMDFGGVFRSDNRGASWRRLGSFRCPDAKALSIAPSDPDRLYLAAREKRTRDGTINPGGVFASRDGGITWTRVLADRFIEAVTVDPRVADLVYAGGNDHPFHDECLGLGVMRSRDGGQTWESLNTRELTCRKITALTLDPHQPARVYAGTAGNGVFVRD